MLDPFTKVNRMALEHGSALDHSSEKEALPDNYRGVHRLDMRTCVNCGACAYICPNRTIDMVGVETPDKRIIRFPQIDIGRCSFCALCEEVCPTKCLVLTKNTELEAFDRRGFVKKPEELK
jgi:formate hydrogenlyase subunit 6/NADH:ubiquinone oxidoreductase subunit I